MKLLKVLSASAAATVLAASMAVYASAASYQDCVAAAKEAGVQSHNVQQLSNFLESADAAGKFTSADYDYMIEVLNGVRDTYVAPYASELFGKAPGDLTEDEKIEIGKQWSEADKAAIQKALLDLGDKYGVTIDIDGLTNSEYNVNAYFDKDSDGKGDTPAPGKTDTPVAPTGGIAETEDVNTGAIAFAGLALVIAATGVVVVAKKNKA